MGCRRTAVIFVDKDSIFYHELNDGKIAFCVDNGDVDSACEKIIKLCDDDEARIEFENNAYDYVYTKFSMDKNTNLMIEMFDKIVGR